MAASVTSEPILVLYKSAACRHCRELEQMWDSVVNAVKTVYPKLRFYTLTTKDNTGAFDEHLAPKYLRRYAAWFPMILLVPGQLWDQAMSKLGPANPVQLKEGVQIMNGSWIGEKVVYQPKHNVRKADDFAKWVKEALAHPEFQKLQFPPPPVVEAPREIAPLMGNIIRPASSDSGPAKEAPKARLAEIEDISANICSMRIRARP